MLVFAENLKSSFASEATRCLANGLDTSKMDDFLDQLFHLADEMGSVSISFLEDNRILRLESKNLIFQDMIVSRPKTKLRMLCARLAVRCGEWAKREVSPYGESLDLEVPFAKGFFNVRFENTTAMQSITIVTHSTNGTLDQFPHSKPTSLSPT